MRVRFGLILALAALSHGPPTYAAAASNNGYAVAIRALQREDTRLHSIAWRLASANARFCAERDAGIGLLLYDVRNYTRSEDVRNALGIQGDIAVGAIAEGSPAAAAGVRKGDAVLAIDDIHMHAQPPVGRGDYARVDGLHDTIEKAAADRGSVTLRVASGGMPPREVVVSAAPACRSRFELLTTGQKAQADGRRVQVGRAALAATADDAEAAWLIAHELGHNILAHRRRLAVVDRATGAIRATEREADRLAPWLMANAGYDPAAAIRYRATVGRRGDPGLFNDGTHDGWRDRLRSTEAEVRAIALARAAAPDAPLDWRPRFAPVPLR